jgi:hypothetical protein
MSRRGNPNWLKAYVPAPYRLSEFEQQVEALGLRPDQYQASPDLQRWCRRNANTHYVPEDLLRLWGIDVKERMSEPAPEHSAISASDQILGEGAVPLAVTTDGTRPACNSIKSDEKARAAVSALHKLEAQTRYGINLTDYIPTAREAYSAVELFLQSANAKRSPEFSRMLTNTVKWYKAADILYRGKLAKTNGGRLSSIALCWDAHYPDSEDAALYEKHPELRIAFKEDDGNQNSYLSYADAPQKAWRLADAELARADKCMK